ncbi:hypothetical protein PV10_08483 [Exophiala mesophila]|uniref:Uncharacterized protein n=1 Tax=Exophiala mesophila TaxID=212818 RepID=A0A0D1WIZ1_EXOME|nr:uncharacterized protein PV10_08483 [Exophiala mesophila]KIV88845.1 hypothetical protein PV10_08483 [Exophiala mesophila]
MPMTWDENADARLFAGLLTTHDITVDYKKLAAFMGNGKNPPLVPFTLIVKYESNISITLGCTPKAITHRISKIRSIAKTIINTGNDNGMGTATAATPTPTPTGKRGYTKATTAAKPDSEEHPAKKQKCPAKPNKKTKAAPVMAKIEDGDDEDFEHDNNNHDNWNGNFIKAEN